MGDFTIRIPTTRVSVPDATVAELLVEAGQHIAAGDALFMIETEKVESEIEAGASGTVHCTAELGTVYEIGTESGLIRMAD